MARDFQSMLSRSLNERRAWESDIKYRLYVKPLGRRGLHVVKSSIDGQEFIVSGPGRTFRPGTVVPTGSNTGTQGEFIVSDPPPGRRGAGRVSQQQWTHQAGGCPQSILGRTYIGIIDEVSTHTLYAYSYADGKLGALIDQVTLPSDLQHASPGRWGWQLVNPSIIVWTQLNNDQDNETIGIWNLGGSAGETGNDAGSSFRGNCMVFGGELYFIDETGDPDIVEALRVDPVIGDFADNDDDIEDPIPDRELGQDLVVIGGVHYTWSSGNPARWISSSSTGPDIGSGGGKVGGPVAFGGCVIGRGGGPSWVQENLVQLSLWPGGWSLGGQVNISLTPLEYSWYDPSSGSLVRFGAIQNFSSVDTSRCPLPVIDVELSPKGRPDVMLPL